MSDDALLPFDLPSVRRKKLTVFDGGNQSSDGGLLLLREAERKLGVCARLPAAMPDRRDGRAEATASGSKDAATIRSFPSRDHLRRRSTDVTTSTVFVIGAVLVVSPLVRKREADTLASELE
jgi:hypothetical protein